MHLNSTAFLRPLNLLLLNNDLVLFLFIKICAKNFTEIFIATKILKKYFILEVQQSFKVVAHKRATY